ncbi:unnamed protein product [Caenorhabditis auriculariae]|uniref:Uncharacterized protein n=1 Tax=Caenorhabditis auriculariae TaxID=2777116 RepID=A0A8S1H5Z1_9PELO|nr:unnamed protein product [Caenorhabditis auriculariae]
MQVSYMLLSVVLAMLCLVAHAVQYDYEPFEASVVSKRLRGEPIRFGKRSPREPIRFGKRFDPMGYADYQ